MDHPKDISQNQTVELLSTETIVSSLKHFLNRIPMPLAGIMLAYGTLGNVLQSYHNGFRIVCGIIAVLLFLITTSKFLTNLPALKKELDTSIGGSVFLTYSMGIIVLSSYMLNFNKTMALILWLLGILLHTFLLLRFIRKFVWHLKLEQVFPTWFISNAGIASAAITGKHFIPWIGTICFWIGFIGYIVTLVLMGLRFYRHRSLPESTLPTLVILTSPGSLCLSGFLVSVPDKSLGFFWFLFILSQSLYLVALIIYARLLKLKFYPSYTSYTFPLVVSSLAMKLSNEYLRNQGISISLLNYLVHIEIAIGVCSVIYVSIRYMMYLSQRS